MAILFFIPLTFIAFYESTSKRKYIWMENLFSGEDEAPQDCPEHRDPEIDDPNCEGLKINKVPFEELTKAFLKIDQVTLVFSSSQMIVDNFFFLQSSEANILKEIRDVKYQLHALMEKLDKLHS